MQTLSLFSKSHIDHLNRGNLKIFPGVGVSSIFFFVVMRCVINFFCRVAVFRDPQCPPLYAAERIKVGLSEGRTTRVNCFIPFNSFVWNLEESPRFLPVQPGQSKWLKTDKDAFD